MIRKIWAVIILLFLSLSAVIAAENTGFDLLENEKIGEFSINMTGKSLKQKLRCAFKYGKEEMWEADGLYHQSWDCPAAGISFGLSSERKDGNKHVDSITITAPSKLKTRRGIGIGDTAAKVAQVYNDVKDAEGRSSKEVFVAGSVYGGMFFYFTNNKVTSIMLGAGAE